MKDITRATTMYKQGDSWIISSYDPSAHCYRLSEGWSYFAARAVVGAANCRYRSKPDQCPYQSHNHEQS